PRPRISAVTDQVAGYIGGQIAGQVASNRVAGPLDHEALERRARAAGRSNRRATGSTVGPNHGVTEVANAAFAHPFQLRLALRSQRIGFFAPACEGRAAPQTRGG